MVRILLILLRTRASGEVVDGLSSDNNLHSFGLNHVVPSTETRALPVLAMPSDRLARILCLERSAVQYVAVEHKRGYSGLARECEWIPAHLAPAAVL